MPKMTREEKKERKRLQLLEKERLIAEQLSTQRKKDEKYMKEAIKQAKKAYDLNETPIGCIIVKNDKIIARGYNRRNTDGTALGHAEISAIKKACRKMNDWRLEECTIYITLEPCQMCSGAIVQSRIPRVVIGAMNKKSGCAGSVINILNMKEFNHRCEVVTGVLSPECSLIMSDFFSELRNTPKKTLKTNSNECSKKTL